MLWLNILIANIETIPFGDMSTARNQQQSILEKYIYRSGKFFAKSSYREGILSYANRKPEALA